MPSPRLAFARIRLARVRLAMVLASLLVAASATSWAARVTPSLKVENWSWSDRVPAGHRVTVSGLYGDIVVVPTLNSTLRVTARKAGRLQDPSEVQIRVANDRDGITVCTVYPGRHDACEPGEGREHTLDRDTDVDFRVELPVGSPLVARTIYGDIDIRGISATVDASTDQGRCRVETSRGGRVRTLSGDIRLQLGRMLPGAHLSVESINGQLRIEVPKDFDATITARTENGAITSELSGGLEGSPARTARWSFGAPRGTIECVTENGRIAVVRGR
ncbi:MAG: DUF4097 family beta strand repeat protein [Candidatus Eisenbacteria bacterium]|uniref:DUF4097 family beta strand repeat protein n=1 Tax=Eiseniibacteriota bacterium TaxID=2212470 RepID=A0A849SBV4_UNCEI|nr:DUF4097 family beta strand repeat protein [Candidatus Eisenbacteria bacterium]